MNKLREVLEDLRAYWEELQWQASDEHRQMVKLRLQAHEKAMSEGYDSPYVDPDNYDSNWNLIIKRQP